MSDTMEVKQTNVKYEANESVHLKSDLNHIESIDGTGGHTLGSTLLVTTEGHVRRIPVPTSDPNDPLNFSKWQKVGIVFSCCWFSVMSLSLSGSLGAIIGIFAQIYIPEGHTSQEIAWLLTFPPLFIGVGNFLVLPIALVFGRRPTFLFSSIGLLLSTIGCAVNQNYTGHLAARIIQGLTTGCTESVLPLILADITFIHQRGMIYGWYWATQSMFSAILGLASSYEAVGLSWRWFYGVYPITVGVGTFFIFFLTFETRYYRPATAIEGQVVFTDEFGVTRVMSDEEARENSALVEAQSHHDVDTSIPKKSYIQSLSVWPRKSKHAVRTVLKCYLHMAESLTSPGIIFALLCASIVLGCAIGLSLTYNSVLVNVYGWPAENVGLINIGTIPACFLGMGYAGFLGDKITVWLAKRNNGVHTPEHRLTLLILPGIIGFGALLLYGFTAGNSSGNLTWWGPYMGWNIYQFTFVSMLIITTTFAAEAWPKNPGPAIVMVVGGKNLISFGASYGLIPMVTEHGYPWACGILAGIYAVIFLLGIPVYFLNPKWRKYVSKMEAKKKLTEEGRVEAA